MDNSLLPVVLRDFEFLVSTVFIAGPGSVSRVGEIAQKQGMASVLIVTDSGIVQAGLLEPVKESLDQAGIKFAIYDRVVPNPRIATVTGGLDAYRKNQCDGLLAVGGGSSIDTAKGIRVVEAHGGTIDEFEYPAPIPNPLPPMVAIPTTYGTGSEATSGAVITNEYKEYKFGVDDPKMTANYAILDPLLLLKLPPSIAAATGMDALTHAIEAYTTFESRPFSDALNLQAIRLIVANLPPAMSTEWDLEATANMLYASAMAGIGMQTCGGLGLVHGMAHALGGLIDMPHGVANAILLPWVMAFNLPACAGRLKDIAMTMGEPVYDLSDWEAAE
ncbi:MAG: iron-containing alcohol dehydrogenase, partial [Anaerolineales bacterium]|nr:iron-containing alcohol dehydrogenase [Anaerolineales bacterium]